MLNERYALIIALLPIGSLAAGQNNAIIQRSVEDNKHDWDAAPKFDCSERDRTSEGSKTYQDTMILGSPYQRLIAVNGEPLTPAQADEEKRKLENTISERKNEPPQKQAERIAKYEEERKRDHSMMEEMVKAFDFKLLGETKLRGRAVFFLTASPRPGYHPPNMETEALTGMQGKLWIDKRTFQWVKVEAEVKHPVSIKGFLRRWNPELISNWRKSRWRRASGWQNTLPCGHAPKS